MIRALRNHPWLAVVAVAALLAGCSSGSSSGGGNTAPTLALTTPAADLDVQIGAMVQVGYTDDDPDDVAQTTLFADADGDLTTQGDQYVIAAGRPDGDGAVQTVGWDTTGIPEGSYFLVGLADDGTNTPVLDTCPGRVHVWELWPRDHTNLFLRDRRGDILAAGSTEPYSPRQTCGYCHDYDEIANGYHFQQGRTDATGAVHMQDDFNADGRSWLLSDGMYGKW